MKTRLGSEIIKVLNKTDITVNQLAIIIGKMLEVNKVMGLTGAEADRLIEQRLDNPPKVD